MSSAAPLVTAADLEQFPDDNVRYELVDGRVIRMSPVSPLHGWTVAQICFLLEQHLRSRRAGAVVADVGLVLRENPDTVRGPDIAYLREDRLADLHTRGFLHHPPDLAIEVCSPDDPLRELHAKAVEYLTGGVLVVLIVQPDKRSVTVHRRLAPPLTLANGDDVLDLGDVIPDFRCDLSRFFGRTWDEVASPHATSGAPPSSDATRTSTPSSRWPIAALMRS